MAPWISKLLLITRSTSSYGALIVTVAALGWLSLRLQAIPNIQIRPWEAESAPLIIVDAGHGGQDGGAVAGGLIEKNLSLILAQKLRDELKELGLRVKMTRDSDVFIELAERSQIAAEAKAALFISLHLNTSATPTVNGIETYYAEQKSLIARRSRAGSSGKNASASLARCVQQMICLGAKAEDRGIKSKNYAVVTHTPCPAILIECGFLTNEEEAAKLKRSDYQTRLTRGVAAGVAEYLKTQPASSTETKESLERIETEPEVKLEVVDP